MIEGILFWRMSFFGKIKKWKLPHFDAYVCIFSTYIPTIFYIDEGE